MRETVKDVKDVLSDIKLMHGQIKGLLDLTQSICPDDADDETLVYSNFFIFKSIYQRTSPVSLSRIFCNKWIKWFKALNP